MWRALAVKELRENIGLAAVALLAYLAVVASVTRIAPDLAGLVMFGSYLIYGRESEVPFVGTGFLFRFVQVAVLFSLALGFRQSLAEAVGGRFQWLGHRPLRRWRIVAAKLAVGAGLYLVVSAIPILLLAAWAATPGTHASPFFWSMTGPAWWTWFTMLVLYLGAFLSGVRPGRWYGSRLWPVAAAGLAVVLLNVIPWWPVQAVLLVVVAGLFTGTIGQVVETRDYS